MSNETITLGNNMEPPLVDAEVTQNVYDCVRTDEFEVAVFNSLLLAIVTYLDAHEVEFGDASLPWSETVKAC